MPTPYSSQDLNRTFDARALTRGRGLGLAGAVEVQLDGDAILGTVMDRDTPRSVRIVPSAMGRRVVFDHECSCRIRGCPHLAAVAFAALDRFPALRRAEQQTFLDTLAPAVPEKERQRLVLELAPADGRHACSVAALLIGERTGTIAPITAAALAADATVPEAVRELVYLIGEGVEPRTGIAADLVTDVLHALIETGQARWHAGGKPLVKGETRYFASAAAATLPARSGVVVADTGPWYVDATTGEVGRIRIRTPEAVPRPAVAVAPRPVPAQLPTLPQGRPASYAPIGPVPRAPASIPESLQRRRGGAADPVEPAIVDRPMTPGLRLTRFPCPDERGRIVPCDALLLEFDYAGATIPFDDDRQFVRANTPYGPEFVRRDRKAEAAALDAIRGDGLVQMRMATGQSAKGRTVFVFRGSDAPENWQAFVTERLPALSGLGWNNRVDAAFGPRIAATEGHCDMQVADSASGGFALDLGIDIDGTRHPLLPILLRLQERGGMASARVVGGLLVTSLDDGRILQLPAARIARLLAVMDDLTESAHRTKGDTLELDAEQAADVLDLEDILATRWQDGATAAAHVARLRSAAEAPHVPVPPAFAATLRPYQQHGVNWLQYLRGNDLGALLADEMGLGKTAQTIAHIAIEHAEGRLDTPALVVVPTTLVPNWTAELARFAPHLRVSVLYGLDRHARRADLIGVHVVVTTYTVLTRDIAEMAELPWHIVVLDEAQAIKTPSSKATIAVCRLRAGQRICLSGTPIENHLGELWSQFAFLMPGLLGTRKTFSRRFRTPIEKDGDLVRRAQLGARIRPFILRRTKAAVATELPPKHTILRRIELAPDQRELYETIRETMQARVVAGIAERGIGRSHVLVLDALLKLRQVCCDPRLARLGDAASAGTSSKLDDMLEMVGEMIAEGRRILLFSQFTSMLDLMKPAFTAIGIPYVELRGDTVDRAEPVRAFEAGEVPLFLISLKAGGRGLNLVSADTVIHYDPWWNPAVEDQASDRAHRIGQTKSVFVYKLIAADTVEERIVEMQERKAALASIALGEDGAALPPLDLEDIDYLFGATQPLLAA